MSKPKWHEAWQDAFDEGYEEQSEAEGERKQKKAIAIRRNEDGSHEIVKVATGVEAERLIAEAESQGLTVEQDQGRVEQLMAEQTGATDVPPEVYSLMSAVIDFAQELNAEWESRYDDLLDQDEDLGAAAEFEYTMDDVEKPDEA